MKQLIFVGALIFSQLAVLADNQYRIGEARDANGQLVYRELHRLSWKDGKLQETEVYYEAADGKLLAAMRSNFGNGFALPETLFVTAGLTQSYRVAKQSADQLKVSYRDEDGWRRESIPLRKDAVVGQGFSYLITDNIERWQPGAKGQIAFLMPGRFDYFRFNLSAGAREGGRQQLKMRISNVLFRLFVDEITVEHDLESGLLMRYDGPSNVLYDADDNPVAVTITYRDSDDGAFAALVSSATALLANGP